MLYFFFEFLDCLFDREKILRNIPETIPSDKYNKYMMMIVEMWDPDVRDFMIALIKFVQMFVNKQYSINKDELGI